MICGESPTNSISRHLPPALAAKPPNCAPRPDVRCARQYIVASCLPALRVLTLADALHMPAMVTIVVAIAESIVSMRLEKAGLAGKAKMLDRYCVWLLDGVLAGTGMFLWSTFTGTA